MNHEVEALALLRMNGKETTVNRLCFKGGGLQVGLCTLTSEPLEPLLNFGPSIRLHERQNQSVEHVGWQSMRPWGTDASARG